jgi:hypothetical protein
MNEVLFIRILRYRPTLYIAAGISLLSQLMLTRIILQVLSGFDLLRLQTTFSPDEFATTTLAWSHEQLQTFLSHYYLDMYYPLYYGIFLAAALRQFTNFSNRIVFIPLFAAVFDEIENICHWSLLNGWVPMGSPAFYIGAIAANLKWLLIAATFLLLVYGASKKYLMRT